MKSILDTGMDCDLDEPEERDDPGWTLEDQREHEYDTA